MDTFVNIFNNSFHLPGVLEDCGDAPMDGELKYEDLTPGTIVTIGDDLYVVECRKMGGIIVNPVYRIFWDKYHVQKMIEDGTMERYHDED